jgi:hypothetical protein
LPDEEPGFINGRIDGFLEAVEFRTWQGGKDSGPHTDDSSQDAGGGEGLQ